MIKSSTYLNAVPLAREINAMGLTVTARSNTVLSMLNEASAGMFDAATADSSTTNLPYVLGNPKLAQQMHRTANERADDVAYATSDTNESSEHSKIVLQVADQISPYITSHLSAARNMVAPLVIDLAEKLHRFVTSKPIDPSSLFCINKRVVPLIVQDESFMSDLEPYQNATASWTGFSKQLDIPDEDSFYEALVDVGNDRLNGLIQGWLGEKGLDFIKAVYALIFAQRWEYEQRYPQFDWRELSITHDPSRSDNLYHVMDMNLAVYLISTKLLSQVAPSSNYPLALYKEEMRHAADFAASHVWRVLKVLSRQHEQKMVVSGIDVLKKEITVHAALYEAYLANGGTPEVLLGMLVSGNRLFTMDAIQEQQEKLKTAWQQYVVLSQADIRQTITRQFLIYAKDEVIRGLDDLTPLEEEYALTYPQYKAKIANLVDAELKKLDHRAMEDIDHTALHLIAKCRFYYTSAYAILYEMQVVARENPDIDPREAALLSTIKYLAEYFADQIYVTK